MKLSVFGLYIVNYTIVYHIMINHKQNCKKLNETERKLLKMSNCTTESSSHELTSSSYELVFGSAELDYSSDESLVRTNYALVRPN